MQRAGQVEPWDRNESITPGDDHCWEHLIFLIARTVTKGWTGVKNTFCTLKRYFPTLEPEIRLLCCFTKLWRNLFSSPPIILSGQCISTYLLKLCSHTLASMGVSSTKRRSICWSIGCQWSFHSCMKFFYQRKYSWNSRLGSIPIGEEFILSLYFWLC